MNINSIFCLVKKESVKFERCEYILNKYSQLKEEDVYIGDYDVVYKDSQIVGIAYNKGFLEVNNPKVEKIYKGFISKNKYVTNWDGYYDCFCRDVFLSSELSLEVRQVIGSQIYIIDSENLIIRMPVWSSDVLALAQKGRPKGSNI